MQVGNKWVSSLAVRLPAAGVELLQDIWAIPVSDVTLCALKTFSN